MNKIKDREAERGREEKERREIDTDTHTGRQVGREGENEEKLH